MKDKKYKKMQKDFHQGNFRISYKTNGGSKMGLEEFEAQEKLELCPKCCKIWMWRDVKCKCDIETKEYWQVYEQFKPNLPFLPKIGQKIQIPKIVLFRGSELLDRCDNNLRPKVA